MEDLLLEIVAFGAVSIASFFAITIPFWIITKVFPCKPQD